MGPPVQGRGPCAASGWGGGTVTPFAVFVGGLAIVTLVEAAKGIPAAGEERWFRIGVVSGLFTATATGILFLLAHVLLGGPA